MSNGILNWLIGDIDYLRGHTSMESMSADESWTDARTEQVAVPSDSPTLADALREIGRQRPAPELDFKVTIESGHAIQGGFTVGSRDLSHVTIKSEDATVPVAADYPDEHLLNVTDGGVSPIFDILVDGTNADPIAANLIRAARGSTALVTTGSGCDGGFYKGIGVLYNSLAICDDDGTNGAIFRNMDEGIHASQNALVIAQHADLTNNVGGDAALRAGGSSAVDISRSDLSGSDTGVRATSCAAVDFDFGTADNCNGNAISTDTGARVGADSASLTGAGSDAIFVQGSHADLRGVTATNAGGAGIKCHYGFANLENADLSGAANTNEVFRGGRVMAEGATVSTAAATDVDCFRGWWNLNNATTTNGSPDVGDTNLGSLNSLTSNGYILG